MECVLKQIVYVCLSVIVITGTIVYVRAIGRITND